MDAYLSEAEAWREIAERIHNNQWARCGLCLETEVMMDRGEITGATQMDMQERIDAELKRVDNGNVYLFPPGVAQPRIELALTFAAAAEVDVLL
jgi:hypothetical protein